MADDGATRKRLRSAAAFFLLDYEDQRLGEIVRMLELRVRAGGLEDYRGRTGHRSVQRLALGGREERIFRAPDYDRERVEDLADFGADVRLVAGHGIDHVGLGLKVVAEFTHHALVNEFGHRGQIE